MTEEQAAVLITSVASVNSSLTTLLTVVQWLELYCAVLTIFVIVSAFKRN